MENTNTLIDLCRRIVNRAIRCKKIKELEAPAILMKGEETLLQEAIDDLVKYASDEGILD